MTYTFTSGFRKCVKRLNQQQKKRVKQQIQKILQNPLVGKPMRRNRKNTREVYVGPYRLSYYVQGDAIEFLEFYHKDEQ